MLKKDKSKNNFLNEQVASIIGAIGDAISIQSTDFRIVYQNNKHKELLGEHEDEYCYKAYRQRNENCEGCPLALSFEKDAVSKVERKISFGDKARYFEITASPLKDADGKIIAGIEVVRDITERKQAETELQKVQKLESLGILAGGIAHDFNNILTAITGNISLAKMYARPGLEIFDILTEVEKASLRAKNLTKQLLTFSKGGIPIKKAVDTARIIKNAVEIEGISSERCKLAISDDAWPVEVDEGQVSSAISNLIINAQEAMPEGGEIILRVENVNIETKNYLPLEIGRYVKISVEDHGYGIPDEHIHNIFDPYFTTKQEGSGLGLTTAYSIINKHNGHIEVESKQGAGTKFMIYLPASEESAQPSKAHDRDYVPFTRKGKVLIMDDDEIVRIVVCRMIEQCGYETAVATEGGEAIDVYKKALELGQPFDVVIIDLTISFGMGGKETIAKLIEIDPHVKAIVSSGYSDDPILANSKSMDLRMHWLNLMRLQS